MARINRTQVFRGWPSWRYGPYGEAQIFNSPDEVPYGWTKKPGEVFVPPPAVVTLDREQLAKDLTDKGIEVNPTWSAAYMKELLEQ